jgi:osmotically-inducible protein OsmY
VAADLATIHSHLEQGYFTQEDMDALGMKGIVSLAQMRAEVGSLFKKEAPPPQVDNNAELRAEASQEAAASEAQEQADREALIASIAEKQEEAQQEVLKQNQANEIAERFKEALKQDPNVTLT